jgi:chromosome segregation ATPase
MVDQSGLTIDQVRVQWQESERLLDEVRVRLESIATSREATERARLGIEASQDELRSLTNLLSDSVSKLEEGLRSAAAALESIVRTAEASQPGKMQASIEESNERLGTVAQGQESLGRNLESISRELSEVTAMVKDIRDSAGARISLAEQATADVQSELTAFRAKVAQAAQSLPGRYQGRFRSSLGMDG